MKQIEITHWVTMIDRYMSGWGRGANMINKLVISCYTYEEAVIVEENANNRSEMKNVSIRTTEPYYNTDKYLVSYHGRHEDTYNNWFTPGFFSPEPKATNTQIKNDQRNLMNIAKIFTKPTGAITQTLHDSALNERLFKFCRLQNTGLTAKQIESFAFKLTDAEKLSILSKASNKAPLKREYMEEMQRLLIRVYGEEEHNKIFDSSPPEKPQWLDIWGNK